MLFKRLAVGSYFFYHGSLKKASAFKSQILNIFA